MVCMLVVPSPAASTCVRNIIPMASAMIAMTPTTTTNVRLLPDRSTVAALPLDSAAKMCPDIRPPPVGASPITSTSNAFRATAPRRRRGRAPWPGSRAFLCAGVYAGLFSPRVSGLRDGPQRFPALDPSPGGGLQRPGHGERRGRAVAGDVEVFDEPA